MFGKMNPVGAGGKQGGGPGMRPRAGMGGGWGGALVRGVVWRCPPKK